MFSAILMYVLLLVLLNVILMVPLRIQTSVSIWSMPLGIPLIENKSNKRVKTERQKRWNTETKMHHKRYKGEQKERQNHVKHCKTEKK